MAQIGTTPALSYDDPAVVDLEVYHYWVKACNACNCGPLSTADDGFRPGEVELPFGVYIPLVLH